MDLVQVLPKLLLSNTTNIRIHLDSTHGIAVDKAHQAGVRTSATETVDALYAKLLLRLGESKSGLGQEILRRTVDQQIVDQTLLDLIIIRRLPFSCVEWPEWDAFIRALNPQGHTFMPASHRTIKDRIDTWFPQAKDMVRKRLQSSQTSIRLAVDIWTSPSYDVLYRPTHPSHRQASPPLNDFERLRQNVKEKNNRPQSQDEFENHCNEAASYDIKMPALEWWLQDTQRRRWPQLSRWSIEILSVPSTSAKPERIFSGGHRTVTWDKTSMTAATLERLECGRDWKRDDLLKDDF